MFCLDTTIYLEKNGHNQKELVSYTQNWQVQAPQSGISMLKADPG